MAERIRLLRNLTGVVPRPCRASVLHVPAWRRFSQSSSRIEQKVLPNACSRAKGRDWRIVSAIVAVVASLAGYGVSKIPNGDANVPNRMTGVLDPERLPPVKYATLEDMKKVNPDQMTLNSLLHALATQRLNYALTHCHSTGHSRNRIRTP